jgi:hypothetical protein
MALKCSKVSIKIASDKKHKLNKNLQSRKKQMSMFCPFIGLSSCHSWRPLKGSERADVKSYAQTFVLSKKQGDQMSLWKKSPKM